MTQPVRSLPTKIVCGLGALATLCNGAIHLREWLDTYKDIPSELEGSFVVKVGFPVNAGLSLLLALALAYVALRAQPKRSGLFVVADALLFNVGSLVALLVSRTEMGLLGWSEPQWTDGANQARIAEITAIALLVVAIALVLRDPDEEPYDDW